MLADELCMEVSDFDRSRATVLSYSMPQDRTFDYPTPFETLYNQAVPSRPNQDELQNDLDDLHVDIVRARRDLKIFEAIAWSLNDIKNLPKARKESEVKEWATTVVKIRDRNMISLASLGNHLELTSTAIKCMQSSTLTCMEHPLFILVKSYKHSFHKLINESDGMYSSAPLVSFCL